MRLITVRSLYNFLLKGEGIVQEFMLQGRVLCRNSCYRGGYCGSK
jgi:hypothetical protein